MVDTHGRDVYKALQYHSFLFLSLHLLQLDISISSLSYLLKMMLVALLLVLSSVMALPQLGQSVYASLGHPLIISWLTHIR
jgi:hypothetical protein